MKTEFFVDLLKTELSTRCKVNPRYSLRAFSAHLGVTSSFLSKLLNGKRPLTEKTLLKMAEKLALSPQQTQEFRKSLKGPKAAVTSMAFNQIEADEFEI